LNAVVVFGGENAGASLEDTWTWDRASNLWSVGYANGPGARTAAAGAYDANRKRWVVFGGLLRTSTGDTYLGDTWEYDPALKTWASISPATSPPPRAYAAVAFDSSRNKTVVFGGRGPAGPAETDSVWEWDGSQWTQRPSINGPHARASSAMVFDSTRARFVLFGGETVLGSTSGLPLGDTWELDPQSATWNSITTGTAPAPRLGHAMYFDSARSRIVLFGGTSSAQLGFADTWEYDPGNAAWTARTVALPAPAARAGHAFVYDAATGHGLMTGGVQYSETGVHTPELDDVWEFDPGAGTWLPRALDAAPAVYRSGIAYDTARHTLVLRGDETRPAMWELTAGRWASKSLVAGQDNFGFSLALDKGEGAMRAEMGPAAVIYDPPRGRTVLFEAGTPPYVDVLGAGGIIPANPPKIWEWDGSTWQLRSCTGAPLDMEHAAIAYDPKDERVVLAGGKPILGDDFSTWEVDLKTCVWTNRSSAVQPPPRWDAMMAWDSARNVAVMFGGIIINDQTELNDTWEWDTAAGVWTQVTPSSVPPPRTQAGMVYDPGRARAVLFGGFSGLTFNPGSVFSDLWEYDGVAHNWLSASPVTKPSARLEPSLAYDPDRGRVVLFGGLGQHVADDGRIDSLMANRDLWDWDGSQWNRRVLGASPGARSGAAGGWMEGRNIGVMFGGVRGDGERAFLNDTWIWQTGEWSRSSDVRSDLSPNEFYPDYSGYFPEYLPPGRAGHAFAMGMSAEDNSILATNGVLFGGEGDTGLLDDTWMWDAGRLMWQPRNGPGSPTPRTGHAIAAIPEVGFFLFGGRDAAGNLLNDDFRWTWTNGWMGDTPYGLPPPRTEHAMATDPVRGKIVLFGGRGVNGALEDTWEYDVNGLSGWTQRSPAIVPSARFGHSMFYDPLRETVVMLGGTGNDVTSNYGDAWEWDGQAGTWSRLFMTADLAARSGAVAFFDASRGSPVVFGGLGYRAGGTAVATYGDTWAMARSNEAPHNGVACTQNSGCGSGFCVDGYCCDTACADPCGACDVAGALGTCTAISGTPHGQRPSCGSAACTSQCNGSDIKACHPAAVGVSCGTPSCANGVISASTCDANAACVPGSPVSCGVYGCAGNACAARCATNSDCAPGALCFADQGTCYVPPQFGSFTTQPTSAHVNQQVTMTSTSSAGSNLQYGFEVITPNNQYLTPPVTVSGTTATAVFKPTVVGTHQFYAWLWSQDSPSDAGVSQSIYMTVTP
jgi:hypothetical protein